MIAKFRTAALGVAVGALALTGCTSGSTARLAAGDTCPPFPGFDQVQETYFGVGQFIPPGEHDPNWQPPLPTEVPRCSLLTVRRDKFDLSSDRPEALQQVGVRSGIDVSYYVVGDPGPLQLFLDWGQGSLPPQTGNIVITPQG